MRDPLTGRVYASFADQVRKAKEAERRAAAARLVDDIGHAIAPAFAELDRRLDRLERHQR